MVNLLVELQLQDGNHTNNNNNLIKGDKGNE